MEAVVEAVRRAATKENVAVSKLATAVTIFRGSFWACG
jgi:hypothetical protein